MRSRLCPVLAALAAITLSLSGVSTATAQIGTAFTYQGQLEDGGVPYTGSADLRFALFANSFSPFPIGPTLTASDVQCSNGRFTVQLDFLTALPAGAQLAISVRTPHDPTDSLPFTALSPRQPVTPAPLARSAETANTANSAATATTASTAATATTATNALALNGQAASFYQDASNLTAGTLASGRLSGTYSNAVGFTNPGNAISGSGAGLTGLNASNIITGTLSPSRGGTGSSIAGATPGQVLKWNGAAFTPQDDLDTNTTYSAGAGLSLSGTTFSIPADGVTGAMILNNAVTNLDLASDSASLGKVSGGALTITGGSATLGTAAPVLAIQSTANGGTAQLDLTETVIGGVGGRLLYDGAANVLRLGTVDSGGGPLVAALSVNRGSPNAAFAGNVSVEGQISIPTTTRYLMLVGPDFVPAYSAYQHFTDYDGVHGTDGNTDMLFFSAPVHLPDGAVITGFTAYVLDNTVGSMTVELVTYGMPGGFFSNLGGINTTGASAAGRSFPSPAMSHTVSNSVRGLTMRAFWTNPVPATAMQLLGVRIDYTITSPLP